MRDQSLKAVKIHGKRVKCEICKKHCAVERFNGVLVCRRCLRPMIIGFMAARVEVVEIPSKKITESSETPCKENAEVGNDDTA